MTGSDDPPPHEIRTGETNDGQQRPQSPSSGSASSLSTGDSSLITQCSSESATRKRVLDIDRDLSVKEKKQKAEDTYVSADWRTEKRDEIDDWVRKIIRKDIFCNYKFLKGEGVITQNKTKDCKLHRQLKKTQYGKTHEKADIVEGNGYPVRILAKIGMTDRTHTVQERASWWKT